MELYDLDRQELTAAQRQIKRLRRAGSLPSAGAYWETTAVPRAGIFTEAALEVVADEAERLGDAIDCFLMAASRSTLEPWISGAEGRAAILSSCTTAIDGLVDAVPQPAQIDQLGEWWQRQLHRRAVVRAIPQVVLASHSPTAVIAEHELVLLDTPPWSYGDRLLSAFELAHAEVRSQASDLANQLNQRVAKRADAGLIETPPGGGPAVIKLTS